MREKKVLIDFILTFVAVAVLDFIWSKYISNIQKKNRLGASIAASIIYLMGSYVIVSYVNNNLLIISASLGAFVGTYISIKKEN